ncbi:hypothetical protein B0A81_20610 [Flavobacterium plurextorum]|uniref:Uncharacterized protein n=1 Tax=Flavobacterium plurextorum TaxID=1114867 RepID=A0ABX4CNU0_9FLAO|nr:hypothetical protein [Flavobacterium plurextorum]OXB00679.1 hypothetical protein B0A81_20610 [Flavobacterium plurextorum]
MKEKIAAPVSIIFLWGLILIAITEWYYEYVRYYLYVSIAVIIPIMIWNLIKQKKKDKISGTREFQSSIYRMLIMAVVLIIIFYITKQEHIG